MKGKLYKIMFAIIKEIFMALCVPNQTEDLNLSSST